MTIAVRLRPGDARAALLLTVIASACAHGDGTAVAVVPVPPPAAAVAPAPSAAEPASAVDFARDVRPILERRCQPCHFTGGVMYARLPFDREATVHELGEKLFTRIRDAEEQRTIRALLAGAAR